MDYRIKLKDEHKTTYSLQIAAEKQDIAVQLALDKMTDRLKRKFELLSVESS